MPRRDDMTLNDALSDYRRVRRGRFSATTWEAHEGQLERWREWIVRELGANPLLATIAEPDDRYMERYFNRLRPPAYAPSSFNNYRQYLNAFWRYCQGEGWIRVNPMRHVDPLRVPRTVRLQLSAAELIGMLEQAEPRDRIGLALGMNTALRGGDIAKLKVGQVNLSNNYIQAWLEKTDEEMLVPITAELRAEIIRWFQHYASAQGLDDWHDLPNDWTLVPPMQGQANNVHDPAAGYRVVYKPERTYRHPEEIVHRALEKLDLPTYKEGFHTLRRSFARVLFDQAVADGVGDPIRMPQTLLNHKSRATTEHYLGVTREKQMLDDMMRGQSVLYRAVETEQAATAEAETYREGRASA